MDKDGDDEEDEDELDDIQGGRELRGKEGQWGSKD